MAKTKLDIGGMFLRLIGGILIGLLSIVGCSDMPYTGSMLTVEDVDRYITINEDSACLLSGDGSACITLVPEKEDDNKPIIHIHPKKIVYVFYREGVKIMQAEMVTDTTEIVEQVKGSGEEDQPVTDDDGDSTQEQDTPLPPPPPLPPLPPLPPPPPPSNGGNQKGGDTQNGDQNGGDTQNGDQNGGTQNGGGTPPPPKVATTLEKVSGDGQSAEVSTQLSDPLVVRVLDQDGAVLNGVSVSFSVSPTDGTLSASTAITNAQGEASTRLTLGSTVGTYTVTASASGITGTVSFTATATAAPKVATTLEKASGDGQSAEVSTQLSDPLVVRVLDQDGAVLNGVSVSFSVSPTDGTLSASTAITNAQGEASTRLTLGSTVGTYTVTARVSSIATIVSFTATATAPPPPPPKVATTLEKVSGDEQSAQVSTALSNPLVVRVLDQNRAVLRGVSVSFSVSPTDGTLSVSTATTGSNGQASTRLTLGSTVGTYTITASTTKTDGTKLEVSFTATATSNGGQNGGTQQPNGNTEQPDVSNPPTDTGDNNNGDSNNGGNGNNNGNNGGDGNEGGTNPNPKKISVHGGTDDGGETTLKNTGLIYLEIRTGAHDEFPCANPLKVTAYTDMEATVPRAHQHWAACRDATGNVTIFLYMHPALTCDVGPNTHILRVAGVPGPIIIIIEACSP